MDCGPALGVASAILVLAPGMGVVRPLLSEVLGERYVPALGVGFAAAILAALVGLSRSLARIVRSRGAPLRFALLTLGPVAVATQQLLSKRGTAAEAAVERAHIVLYGALMLLVMRALFRRRSVRPGSRPGLEVPLVGLLLVAVVAFLDEGLQWLLAVRTGELYDVAFNLFCAVAASVSGSGLFPLRPRVALGELRRLAVVTGFVLPLLAAAFFEVAHLGYTVRDPDLGSFRSYYAPTVLPSVDRDRARQWSRQPPNRPFRLGDLEDPYQTEAAWHVRMRNRALEEGNEELAWRENQILERYYAAFLGLQYDDPRYRYRLGAATRARLAAAFEARPWPGYESGARGLIRVRPVRWLLWAGAASLSLLAVPLGVCSSRLFSGSRGSSRTRGDR